ncbi:DUF2066 domain-containing protein [Mesorhizobium australicum]|uniref:DUF2066 domain-containing protein n=1 Tax=Mesorhizobium australicum TaxID=536018 RepID=A0ACC6T2D2_9HYPH
MPPFLRLAFVLSCLSVLMATNVAAGATDLGDLYHSQTIVTGQGEENRQLGFRTCLDKVLVRVSGDQRLLARREMDALRDKAGSFVDSFRYHDRMEGIPIHDEQGTHDRPHDLTCFYKPDVIDRLLASLGSRPWLGERPTLTVFLTTEQGARHFVLSAEEGRGETMRESFVNATGPMLMHVAFPKAAQLAAWVKERYARRTWQGWIGWPSKPAATERSPAASYGATRNWAGSPIGDWPITARPIAGRCAVSASTRRSVWQ